MRILIVEDEPPIASSIKQSLDTILKGNDPEFYITHTLREAMTLAENKNFDLCFLDLNLSGESGFDLLNKFTSSFYTIIISAYSEKAIEAYEYGVIDFVPKPFHLERLKKAVGRYFKRSHNFSSKAQYIIVHKKDENHFIPVNEIIFLKADRYLIEVHLLSGKTELIEKPLNQLEKILPSQFIRVHRSYIVDLNQIKFVKHHLGGRYQATLINGKSVPISRKQYKTLCL